MHVPSCLVGAYLALAVPLLVLALLRRPRALAASARPDQLLRVLIHALLVLSGTGCQVFALGLAPAAYVASIRRTSAVFSVLMGSALFPRAGPGRPAHRRHPDRAGRGVPGAGALASPLRAVTVAHGERFAVGFPRRMAIGLTTPKEASP